MPDYRNDKITVCYDPEICILTGDCVYALPSVFDVSKKPWVNVNGASPEDIAAQVKKCPSGALSYALARKTE